MCVGKDFLSCSSLTTGIFQYIQFHRLLWAPWHIPVYHFSLPCASFFTYPELWRSLARDSRHRRGPNRPSWAITPRDWPTHYSRVLIPHNRAVFGFVCISRPEFPISVSKASDFYAHCLVSAQSGVWWRLFHRTGPPTSTCVFLLLRVLESWVLDTISMIGLYSPLHFLVFFGHLCPFFALYYGPRCTFLQFPSRPGCRGNLPPYFK